MTVLIVLDTPYVGRPNARLVHGQTGSKISTAALMIMIVDIDSHDEPPRIEMNPKTRVKAEIEHHEVPALRVELQQHPGNAEPDQDEEAPEGGPDEAELPEGYRADVSGQEVQHLQRIDRRVNAPRKARMARIVTPIGLSFAIFDHSVLVLNCRFEYLWCAARFGIRIDVPRGSTRTRHTRHHHQPVAVLSLRLRGFARKGTCPSVLLRP